MKNAPLAIIILLLTGLPAWAQTSETIRVKSGERLAVGDKYLFPQFAVGTVQYRDGRTVSAQLNFNLLLREMQFLNPPRLDTLALAREYTIKQILINDAKFVHDQKAGFMKILGDYGGVRLAVTQSLQVGNVDKEAGYGQSSGVSSIKSVNNLPSDNGSITRLSMKGDVMYSRRESYFLLDENSLTYPANKKSVQKLFARHKSEIGDYIKDNSVQFGNAADLKRLLEFCQGLN
ncbi:hypothetical protein [Persicitalea jodogahamensis]|uniref:Uncharacterized protein n=1 Tax=Persicitalea jodogahamensis TaxID=402147 RepID=A0A8J3D5N6_9BACT|nr:hypothetical protein [Persicitalea jodogahamensis]GHB56609.1 hypothetical protein GCM10007390_07460 [Persicitalea jodogahamensis]